MINKTIIMINKAQMCNKISNDILGCFFAAVNVFIYVPKIVLRI